MTRICDEAFQKSRTETFAYISTGIDLPTTALCPDSGIMAYMDPSTRRILLVEDDLPLRTIVQRYLEENGFNVIVAGDTKTAEGKMDRHHFDLMILDVSLPGEDGFSFCRKLRGREIDIPIIMLTARGNDIDRIIGLEIGADDYLPKPGNPRELVARIRAVLRRRVHHAVGKPQAERGIDAFGRCTLNHATRTLTRNSQAHRLTSGEYALLAVLVRHRGECLTRDRLLSLARGREQEPFDRSIDVTISRLRRVIEDDPKQPRHLQTVWGVGYVFVAD